jgi:hypothetical protein
MGFWQQPGKRWLPAHDVHAIIGSKLLTIGKVRQS